MDDPQGHPCDSAGSPSTRSTRWWSFSAELSEKDFELINFYDIVDAKIIALAKDRELPEIIAKHENTFSYCPPVEITYDEKGYPVLTFGFGLWTIA